MLSEPAPHAPWSKSDTLCSLALVAAAVSALGPLLFQGQSFFRPELFGRDWEGGYVPLATFFAQQVQQGWFPLWTSNYLCGTPYLATTMGGPLYPPTYLFLVDIIIGYKLLLVGHLALLGIFTFRLFRYLNLSRPAAFVASLWMMLSGPVLWFSFIPVGLQELTWFLILYLGLLLLLQRARLKIWLLWTAAFSLELLAGDPETLVYSVLFVFLTFAVHGIFQRITLRVAFRTIILLSGAVIFSGLITLPQTLTALELFSHCIRSVPLDYQAYQQTWFDSHQLLSLAALLLQRQAGELFFGILPLALVLAGLFLAPRGVPRTLARVFLILGLAVFFNRALHLTPLLYHLPLFSLFIRHYKMLPYFQLFLCLGVALGVDAIRLRPRSAITTGAIIPLALLDLFLPSRPLSYQAALAGGYLLLLLVSRTRWPRLLLAALVFLTCTDLFSQLWNTPHCLESPRFAESFHRFFRQADRQARTVVLYPLSARMADGKLPVPIQSGVWEQTSSPDHWLHLPPTRYLFFLSRLVPEIIALQDGKLVAHYIDSALKHLDFLTPANRHLVDFLGLRYFVTYQFPLASAAEPENHLALRVHDEIDIYENLQALPRAFVVHGVRYYEDEGQMLADLGEADRFQPRGEVWLSGPGSDQPPASAAEGEKVELLVYNDHQAEYRVTLFSPGFLSTSESYFPGWRAWVNGQEVRILRSNYAFRALSLPAGASQIVFRYVPVSFRVALWAGIAALFFFLAGGLWYIKFVRASAGSRLSPAGTS